MERVAEDQSKLWGEQVWEKGFLLRRSLVQESLCPRLGDRAQEAGVRNATHGL